MVVMACVEPQSIGVALRRRVAAVAKCHIIDRELA